MLSSLSLITLAATVAAQSSFSPARPPAIPIAVSNPYMNSWLDAGSDGGNGGYLAGEWITFWTNQITGWAGIIRVDGESYTWFGAPTEPSQTVTQSSFEYTSTKSIFVLSAGSVGLNVTFLSPVTPTDLMRQSIPGTYMNVEVYSLDGAEHNVQLYTDVSAEWASGDRSNIATWDFGVTGSASSKQRRDPQARDLNAVYNATTRTATTMSTVTGVAPLPTGTVSAGNIAYHRFERQTQQIFTQDNDQAEWGTWIYATEQVSGLTYSNGAPDVTARGAFVANGSLGNLQDTNYRAISDEYPVFAFSIDYGNISSTAPSSLFTLTLAQEQAIQFESSAGNIQSLPPLWTSAYSDDISLGTFFYNDFQNAQTTAAALDAQVSSDSIAAGGDNYNIITSLSVRQAFAATQLVGTPETYYLFLKEISSDGDIQTTDVIFPSMPIWLYFNPDLLGRLLDPIYIYTEAGLFPQSYALHDLGFYPNATQAGTEMQQLEESGNMVIMTLAYAQRTGDTAYLSSHYSTLVGWTSYLISDALIPQNQISTDDFAGSLANQTNLAIKGIIGIQAMSVIANLTNHPSDGANYSNIAHDYITKWQTLAVANTSSNFSGAPHTTLDYGASDTYSLLYNLYPDTLLDLHLVPSEIYSMQSSFYPIVNLAYGVPLDTRHTYTKSDWQMFCAAVAEPSTRDMFIGDLARFIGETSTDRALTDWYDAESGGFGAGVFTARPVVGGHFSILALNGTTVSPVG